MNIVLIRVTLHKIAGVFARLQVHVILALSLLELRRGRLLEGIQAFVTGHCFVLWAAAETLRVPIVICENRVQLVLTWLILRWRPKTHFLHNSQFLISLRLGRHLHHRAHELLPCHGRGVSTSLQLIILLK